MSSLSYKRYHRKYDKRHAHRDKDAEINESGIVFVREGRKIIGTLGNFRSFAYVSDSENAAKLRIFTEYRSKALESERIQCF